MGDCTSESSTAFFGSLFPNAGMSPMTHTVWRGATRSTNTANRATKAPGPSTRARDAAASSNASEIGFAARPRWKMTDEKAAVENMSRV